MDRPLDELRADLLDAYREGRYRDALETAERAHALFPERHATTWFWKACLLGVQGRGEDALSALQAGLGEGVWWSPDMLDGDKDLTAARALRGYGALRDECARRLRGAEEAARPECLLLSPATSVWEPRSVVFLHGYGETAREFAALWQPLVHEGWTLVVPQSSQWSCSAGFCWDDHERALRDVRGHLEDCRRRRGLSMERMVIAGASQGAPVALEIARGNGLPWLCVIPSFPAGYDVTPLVAVPGHTRGVMVLGESDRANARSLPVLSALRSAGVEVVSHTVSGMGHTLSEAMVARTAAALGELDRGPVDPA